MNEAKRLKITLNESEDNHATFVDKATRRVFPTSVTTTLTAKLLENLDDFISLLENASIDPAVLSYSAGEEDKAKTQHIQYLQHVVDQMTAVFIHFRGANAATRSNDGVATYGEFPDFIRGASKPTLIAFYNGFAIDRRGNENLNVQIQEAVRKAKPLHE